MPTVVIPAKRLREHGIRTPQHLLRVYGPQLQARGFALSESGPDWRRVWSANPPLDVIQDEERNLRVSQEPTGRVPNNDGRLWPLLQRLGAADAAAIQPLYSLLLSEGDDRASVLQSLEVAVPEDVVFAADTGTRGEGHSDQFISGKQWADRQLCGRVLLLFGLREEPL